LQGSVVNVKTTVDKAKSESKELKLQIALVEDLLRYSGENGVRFHPMVVRSLAGPAGDGSKSPSAEGFAVDASKPTTVEHTFDLAKITAELKAHLDDYEINGRHGKITFSEKKHTMDSNSLSVVAFVQDEKSKQILQAAYIKLKPGTSVASN